MARNILVVEDDNNISNLIKMYLDKEGFDVRIAADGGKAVEEFKEKEPDLVLLDVMLPVLDGWGVCAKIRETSKCPIIMLTAKGEVNDRIHGLEMGADDYVVKPFEMKELLHFKGLGEIVIRALLESLHLVVCFALCCEHDHRGLAVLPDGAQDVPAVHHGQHDIEQHQIGPKLPEQVNALSAIGGDPGVVALFFKIHLDKFSDIRIVFDDQDCFCHRRSTLPSDTI